MDFDHVILSERTQPGNHLYAGGWGIGQMLYGYKLATSSKISPRDLTHGIVNTDNNIVL